MVYQIIIKAAIASNLSLVCDDSFQADVKITAAAKKKRSQKDIKKLDLQKLISFIHV